MAQNAYKEDYKASYGNEAPITEQQDEDQYSDIYLAHSIPQEDIRPSSSLTGRGKFMIFASVLILMASMFGLVSSKASWTSASQKLQNTQQEVQALKDEKKTLKQKVSELSDYDRVISIAERQGLKMEEKNIRNVTK